MLGTSGGAAMQLQPKRQRRCISPKGWRPRSPDRRAGSHADMGARLDIADPNLPVLDDIERLVIWADHDPLKKIGGGCAGPE